jgi:uncharacterized protein YfaQ (DUF2300 family)
VSWSTEFEALMPHTVQVGGLASISTDGYGTPVYSTGTAYPARVKGAADLVTDFTGTEQIATTVAWIASTSTFAPDSQITLPDGTTPLLLQLEAVPDEDGTHHVKAWFGAR